MSARVEAAARAMAPSAWGPRVWQFTVHGESPTAARARVQRQALEDAERTLAAADAVMFDDAAVETIARALAQHKWPTAIGVWDSFGQDMKDSFRDQARAVIAALKGDDQ